MKDEDLLTTNWAKEREILSPQSNIPLSDDISKLLASKHDLISTIVDIDIEKEETHLFNIFKRASRDYVYWVLGITIDPAVFAQMTDTLNKHRRILESSKPDNYKTVPLKKAA